MEIILICWVLCGVGAAVVASNRGAEGCLWFGLGVLLGPIGFALAFTTGTRCEKCGSKISNKAEICPNCRHQIISTAPQSSQPATRPCPFCAETILAAAKKCKHCGEFIAPAETPIQGQIVPSASMIEETAPQPTVPRAWTRGEWGAMLIVVGIILLIIVLGVWGGKSEHATSSSAQKTELTPEQTEQNRRDVKELMHRSAERSK